MKDYAVGTWLPLPVMKNTRYLFQGMAGLSPYIAYRIVDNVIKS